MKPDARLDHLRAETEREERRLHVRRGRQEQSAEEDGGSAACRDLVLRQRLGFGGMADRRARLDELVPVPELRGARSDLDRAAGPVARVDTLLGAERADPVHGTLGGTAYLDRAGVADAVAQDRQVVPERRDEAAVASARPVPREAGIEHDDVEPRLERLQLPRRPEAEVAAADDDHVCRRVALERPGGLDRPRLLQPVPVARVPHAVIL